MEHTDFSCIWQNPLLLTNSNIAKIIEKYSEITLLADIQALSNTKYSSYYQNLKPNLFVCEEYLLFRTNINKIRILSQIRLSNSSRGLQIYYRGMKYQLDAQNNCTVCNMQKKEDLFHFFLECPIYQSLRSHFLANYVHDKNINTLFTLTVNDSTKINCIFQFTIQAFCTRSFIINE